MKPIQPPAPAEDDEQLRAALARIDQLERRIAKLERRVAATSPPGWECSVCRRGWVTARGDVLTCNRCSYRRSL
ncbi:DUF4391 domain-containing protein [Natronoarchaeum rubrum]|uniref:DUF4391 domain-containing protein n=1 Tax=Natronoarchaeum rubrum TaxID=755311 RepID=UPI00211309BA|nr:DUF4391 domain-containing protein [Natronoarchaeum rubrum]